MVPRVRPWGRSEETELRRTHRRQYAAARAAWPLPGHAHAASSRLPTRSSTSSSPGAPSLYFCDSSAPLCSLSGRVGCSAAGACEGKAMLLCEDGGWEGRRCAQPSRTERAACLYHSSRMPYCGGCRSGDAPGRKLGWRARASRQIWRRAPPHAASRANRPRGAAALPLPPLAPCLAEPRPQAQHQPNGLPRLRSSDPRSHRAAAAHRGATCWAEASVLPLLSSESQTVAACLCMDTADLVIVGRGRSNIRPTPTTTAQRAAATRSAVGQDDPRQGG